MRFTAASTPGEAERPIMRQNVFPPGLSRRVVAGNLLYAPVVHYVLGAHVSMPAARLIREPV